MIRLLLFLLISMTIALDVEQRSTAQQNVPSALLAFTLVQSDPDVWYSKVRVAYLYDPISRELRTIGHADSLQWSPTGRYLAMMVTTLPIPTQEGGYGPINSFEIRDMVTGDTHGWEYFSGSRLQWLQDEQFLVAQGWVSRSGGANSWVDIFNGDGSGEPPDTHTGYVDGMMGSRGGTSILGLTEEHRIILHEVGAVGRETYWILDPMTRQRTPVEGELPLYTVLPQQTYAEMYGQIGVAISPDYRFAAVTRVDVPQGETTYLMIVELNTGDSHQVELPFSTDTQVFRMAWRTCPVVYMISDC